MRYSCLQRFTFALVSKSMATEHMDNCMELGLVSYITKSNEWLVSNALHIKLIPFQYRSSPILTTEEEFYNLQQCVIPVMLTMMVY